MPQGSCRTRWLPRMHRAKSMRFTRAWSGDSCCSCPALSWRAVACHRCRPRAGRWIWGASSRPPRAVTCSSSWTVARLLQACEATIRRRHERRCARLALDCCSPSSPIRSRSVCTTAMRWWLSECAGNRATGFTGGGLIPCCDTGAWRRRLAISSGRTATLRRRGNGSPSSSPATICRSRSDTVAGCRGSAQDYCDQTRGDHCADHKARVAQSA